MKSIDDHLSMLGLEGNDYLRAPIQPELEAFITDAKGKHRTGILSLNR